MDLKESYQNKAEELAQEQYGEGAEFYDLPDSVQQALYSRAMELVNDMLISRADSLRDERREQGNASRSLFKTGNTRQCH